MPYAQPTSEKAVALASNEGVSAIAGNLFFPLSTLTNSALLTLFSA